MTSPSLRSRVVLFSLAALALAGCGSSTTATDGGTDAGRTDMSGSDGGADGGSTDGGSVDGGATDGGALDAGGRVPANHRADDSACTAAAPPGNCSFGGGSGVTCSMDSECTTGTSGRCNMSTGGGAVFCRCTYDTCAHDTDCATGHTCACHGAAEHADGNECIVSGCRVDADCGAGRFCSPSIGGCGGLVGYFCHTTGDTCLDDSDCSSATLEACEYVSTSSRWECVARMFCP